MAGNSVAANLIMLVFLIGGFLWGTQIQQEVFPEFDLDFVTVSVAYPGASPEEVEQGIILAVEEAVQGLEGVKEVTATAREGSGVVTVEMIAGGDLQRLAQDIQSEVDRITTFPEEAEEPRIEIGAHQREVLSVVVYGNASEKLLRDTVETVRDGLLQMEDITQVELQGVRDLEISIEVPQARLRSYNLTLRDIADKIKALAVELPGGGIKTSGGEILVRMKERRDYGREFVRIPIIASNEGTQVFLEDIATISDGFVDTDTYATYNGLPAAMVGVYRVGEQTPMAVASAVKDYLKNNRHILPTGLKTAIHHDRSTVYSQRLELMLKNGFLGLLLVFVLLGLFLETRLAFWVAMGIPISFLGSLLFLPAMGISINMMSMFAFIVALGIVVDDAIVVGENIYKYRQSGAPALEAAIAGAREVAMPVTFSILTNIAAFLPLYFVPGIMGKVFRTIPVVVITVFIISLIESLFVLPAHLGHRQEKDRRGLHIWLHHRQQAFSAWFVRQIKGRYGPLLHLCLRHRYVVLASGLALLLMVVAYVQSGRMGMAMFPRVESDYAYAEATLPYGIAVKKTEAVERRLIEAAHRIAGKNGGDDLVEGIYAMINGNVSEVRVMLTPPQRRPLSTAEFTRLWRREIGAIPGVENLTFRSDRGGPGSGAALTVDLTHRDLDVLEAAAAQLARDLQNYPNVKDIDDGFSWGKEQVDFKIRPEGRALGLTARNIANQVRNSFYGAEALRQQRGRNEVKVMVRLPEEERISEYSLEELILRTPAGIEVPLRDAVTVKRGRAYTEIDRRAGRRVITVTADVEPQHQAGLILKALEKGPLSALIEKFPGLNYSFEGKQADISESMNNLVRGLLLAMLVIYALLAVPFKSYTQPAIVMLAIPFGIVGAVIGHLLMGYSLSVMSMLGVVALSGVVVNDSLVLIDFANRLRKQGKTAGQAIHAAGITRFRPVMLTTLTTFGGLAPMIFETSRQARFLIPMALSLGFGVLFATLITLILVPVGYLAMEDIHAGLQRKTKVLMPAGKLSEAADEGRS
jgi:multidrug efflux pump subunit AcrB